MPSSIRSSIETDLVTEAEDVSESKADGLEMVII
jgi:hypothetical protein